MVVEGSIGCSIFLTAKMDSMPSNRGDSAAGLPGMDVGAVEMSFESWEKYEPVIGWAKGDGLDAKLTHERLLWTLYGLLADLWRPTWARLGEEAIR